MIFFLFPFTCALSPRCLSFYLSPSLSSCLPPCSPLPCLLDSLIPLPSYLPTYLPPFILNSPFPTSFLIPHSPPVSIPFSSLTSTYFSPFLFTNPLLFSLSHFLSLLSPTPSPPPRASPFPLSYTLVRPPDGAWGIPTEAGDWNGMIGMVKRNVSCRSRFYWIQRMEEAPFFSFSFFLFRENFGVLSRKVR